MIQVIKYSPDYKLEWNAFLSNAKNQTFLFNRNFMDYHADRFVDFSLMVYEDQKLTAMLPANYNQETGTITSHAGLSYGGIIVQENTRSIKTLEYLYYIIKHLFDSNIAFLNFKQLPFFYNLINSDEVDYAFFLLDALLYRVDIASAIRLEHKLEYQERRNRSIKKAQKLNVEVKQDESCTGFWNQILIPNLMGRFGVPPVHSLKEIEMLMSNNAPHIKQFSAYLDGKIMAGATIFETETVSHAQYISASEEGRKNGSLDLLFHQLISNIYSRKQYFDFGIVNEENGRKINNGLLDWKEGFGGRAYAHRFYRIDTSKYTQLEEILK